MINRLVSDRYELDLSDDVPTPVNLSISDLLKPDKRRRKYSKKIKLEGTLNNSSFFASAFSFSANNNAVTFDPTAKVNANLYKNDQLIIEGVLQLNLVTLLDDKYTFTVTVYGEVTDAFLILKNTDIKELDWSAYTHDYTQAAIVASWSTSSGTSYRYPLIERGAGRPGAAIWRVSDLIPYVHLSELLDKVLTLGGIEYTSNWIDTDRIKNILFGFGGGDIPSVSPQDIDDRLIDLDAITYTYSYYTIPTINTQNLVYSSFPSSLLSDLNLTYTVTQDTLGQFNDGVITCQVTGNYRLTFNAVIDWSYNVGTNNYLFSGSPKIKLLKNGVEIANWAQLGSSGLLGQSGTVDISFVKELFLQSGEQLQLAFDFEDVLTQFATDPVRLDVGNSTPITIDFTALDTQLTDGSTIEIGRFLPSMKCSDFLLGCIRQFQLYISDPDDNGRVRIEPLTTFYQPTSTFEDITQLIDYSKEFNIEPSANSYAKTTSFIFKQINDYDAKEYFTKYEERYGDYIHEQGSYVATGDQKIDLPWGTIVPYDVTPDILCPRFIAIDQAGAVKPNKGVGRIMMWNGLKTGSWSLRNITVPWLQSDRTEYPSVHHFDDYENPTFDLNWKLVNEVFYTTNVVTTINSFSEYYYPFINEITNSSCQLVTCYVRYNALDIRNMDFSLLRMINGKLFRLNEIMDFDDNKEATTKIQLIKVLDAKSSKRIELFVPPRDTSINVGTIGSPNGVGQDVGVIRGGDNEVLENSAIIRG